MSSPTGSVVGQLGPDMAIVAAAAAEEEGFGGGRREQGGGGVSGQKCYKHMEIAID